MKMKFLGDTISKTRGFLKETQAEMKKVIWPSREYIFAATAIIFLIVFLVGIFIMAVDYAFVKIFTYLMRGI